MLEKKSPSLEKNPETSDINLFLIISLAALGTLGTAVVLKNRLS